MGISDWINLAVAALGPAMTGLRRRTIQVVGACLLIFAIGGAVWTHLHPWAEAQSPKITNNAPSINTINQSGGTNTIVAARPRLTFDPSVAEAIASRVAPSKLVVIHSVGGAADQAIADKYQEFLQSKGFHVERARFDVKMPSYDHPINIDDRGDKVFVAIDPSILPPTSAPANCGTIKIVGGFISGFRRAITVPPCGNVDLNGMRMDQGGTAVEIRSK